MSTTDNVCFITDDAGSSLFFSQFLLRREVGILLEEKFVREKMMMCSLAELQ